MGSVAATRRDRTVGAMVCLGVLLFGAVGCGSGSSKDGPRHTDADAIIEKRVAEDAQQKAKAGKRVTAVVHSVVPCPRPAEFQRRTGYRAIAVDVELRGIDDDFGLDDVEVVDQNGKPFGGEVIFRVLNLDGTSPRNPATKGPTDRARIRLTCEAPARVTAIKLKYWTNVLTPQPIPVPPDASSATGVQP